MSENPENPLIAVARAKYEEIRSALEEGRQVFISGVKVKTIELKPSKRSVVIIINGDTMIYPSQLRQVRVLIL